MSATPREIKPQAGPQQDFLSTPADIAIFGGAAGGGKSFALLMEFARWYNRKGFSGVIFRRESTQLRDGGLWDESQELYSTLGGRSNDQAMTWRFNSGAMIKMSGLQYEKDKYTHQGKQYAVIGFDELTHFSRSQFFYLLSRNRTTCGVKPYIRATCNPDPDSFVKELIEWWLDDKGYAIPERSGVIRYLFREGETIHWSGDRQELMEKFNCESYEIKSFTFIASSVYDNKILLDRDPSYLGNLKAQNRVDRERLLSGNWKIRPAAGLYFKHEYFPIIETMPTDIVAMCRAWDLAATTKTEGNDPDFTANAKIAKTSEGKYIFLNAGKKQISSASVRKWVKSTAQIDGKSCGIFLPQDPGQAGKDQAIQMVNMLAGYNARRRTMTGDKVVRAGGLSAMAENGMVSLLKGPWNAGFLDELEAFPTDGVHDDYVDAAAEAFNNIELFPMQGPRALVF